MKERLADKELKAFAVMEMYEDGSYEADFDGRAIDLIPMFVAAIAAIYKGSRHDIMPEEFVSVISQHLAIYISVDTDDIEEMINDAEG